MPLVPSLVDTKMSVHSYSCTAMVATDLAEHLGTGGYVPTYFCQIRGRPQNTRPQVVLKRCYTDLSVFFQSSSRSKDGAKSLMLQILFFFILFIGLGHSKLFVFIVVIL